MATPDSQFRGLTGSQVQRMMAETALAPTSGPFHQANTDAFLALARLHAHEDHYYLQRSGRVTRISFPQPKLPRRTWRARCPVFSPTT